MNIPSITYTTLRSCTSSNPISKSASKSSAKKNRIRNAPKIFGVAQQKRDIMFDPKARHEAERLRRLYNVKPSPEIASLRRRPPSSGGGGSRGGSRPPSNSRNRLGGSMVNLSNSGHASSVQASFSRLFCSPSIFLFDTFPANQIICTFFGRALRQ